MAVVLKAVPLDSPPRQGQQRVESVRRLDGTLLVHTKHRCMSRWIKVQAEDIGRFGLELRIIRDDVALQPM